MTSWHETQSAPRAWDYPPRGGTVQTCGCHQPYPHSAFEVLAFRSGDDEIHGWCACPMHALEIKISGDLIDCWVPDEIAEAA